MNLEFRKMFLLSILVAGLFLILGCNQPDRSSDMETKGYVNPLRNNPDSRSARDTSNCFLYINNDLVESKRIVNNNIENVTHLNFGPGYEGIALNDYGSMIMIDGQTIDVAEYYCDASFGEFKYTTTVGLVGTFLTASLSDFDELIIFTLNPGTNRVLYTVGIVNSSSISWIQINSDLNFPCTIAAPEHFAADIGSYSDDNLAFVFYYVSREYRQNGHLNWENGSYTITLNTLSSVSCGTPLELDLAYDRQNHCVWGQWESSNTSWLASQPNADISSWLWTKVADNRIDLRVGLKNGIAVTISTSGTSATMFGSVFNATVKPAVKLSESYATWPNRQGVLDLTF